MDLIISQIFSGLVRSAVYFMVTSGVTLLFGVVGTLNMAHFSMYMVASYITWTFSRLLQGHGYAFWAAFLLAALTMCVFAWIIERLVIRHIYRRVLTEQLLITFAIVYILDDLTKLSWGSTALLVPKPDILTKVLRFGDISLPIASAFVIGLGIITGLATWYMLVKTRVGRILRAAYSFKEMISALGIPINRIYMLVFVMSVLLATIAGAAWSLIGVVDLGQANSVLIEAFCVMVIGGMGSFAGTALSALIVGLAHSFTILFFPKLATPFIFVLAGIVLIIRPWGLMGTPGRLH